MESWPSWQGAITNIMSIKKIIQGYVLLPWSIIVFGHLSEEINFKNDTIVWLQFCKCRLQNVFVRPHEYNLLPLPELCLYLLHQEIYLWQNFSEETSKLQLELVTFFLISLIDCALSSLCSFSLLEGNNTALSLLNFIFVPNGMFLLGGASCMAIAGKISSIPRKNKMSLSSSESGFYFWQAILLITGYENLRFEGSSWSVNFWWHTFLNSKLLLSIYV